MGRDWEEDSVPKRRVSLSLSRSGRRHVGAFQEYPTSTQMGFDMIFAKITVVTGDLAMVSKGRRAADIYKKRAKWAGREPRVLYGRRGGRDGAIAGQRPVSLSSSTSRFWLYIYPMTKQCEYLYLYVSQCYSTPFGCHGYRYYVLNQRSQITRRARVIIWSHKHGGSYKDALWLRL